MAYPYYQNYPYMGNYPQMGNPSIPNYPNTGNGAVPDLMGQYKAPYQIPQSQPPAPASDIIWVQGEAGAKSYLVAPNSTVMLMDSEANTFYFKSSDGSGIPQPLRIFDYVERTQQQKPQEAVQYASVAAVQAMEEEIAVLKKQIETLTAGSAEA